MVATYLDCASMTSPTDSAATRLARPGVVALAIVAVVAQLVVLYWPFVTVEGPVSWTDKVVHLLVFVIHAPVSELVQHFLMPGRSGDGWDVVLDLVGVAVGAAALVVGTRPLRW